MLCFVLPIVILYIICDVNYFLRTFWAIYGGRWLERDYGLEEKVSCYGICLPQDVGATLSMQQSRMIRELDFARFHFWDRTGVYARSVRMGFGALQAATQIIDFKDMPLFTKFRIDTKLDHWDTQSFYLTHTISDVASDRIYSTAISRQHVVRADTRTALGGCRVSPPCPVDVGLWSKAVDSLSVKFRKKDDVKCKHLDLT